MDLGPPHTMTWLSTAPLGRQSAVDFDISPVWGLFVEKTI
jgi:hypothetical protein